MSAGYWIQALSIASKGQLVSVWIWLRIISSYCFSLLLIWSEQYRNIHVLSNNPRLLGRGTYRDGPIATRRSKVWHSAQASCEESSRLFFSDIWPKGPVLMVIFPRNVNVTNLLQYYNTWGLIVLFFPHSFMFTIAFLKKGLL